jgi:pimeloyl-ACP methyl ester carboxylesterase
MELIKDGLVVTEGKALYVKFFKKNENNPTLVFLHDSLGCIQLWRDLPYLLVESLGYNLLIYDRWGYGLSEPMPNHERPKNYLTLEADVLNSLLDYLKIENTILFGHSDGASIALIAASKYTTKIRAVVSEAAHVFVEPITLEGITSAIEAYNTTNLKERLEKYHGDKAESIFMAWTKTWANENFRDWNIEDFLPSITCPILIIQGDKDEYGTINQVNSIEKKVGSNAKKLLISNCGHSPHKEYPKLIFENVNAFLIGLNDK